MKKLRLMADYHCYPLWDLTEGNYGDVDPSSLPISKQLQDDLLDWASLYDSILVIDDPRRSAFASVDAEESFKSQGLALAQRLKAELGCEYSIEVRII